MTPFQRKGRKGRKVKDKRLKNHSAVNESNDNKESDEATSEKFDNDTNLTYFEICRRQIQIQKPLNHCVVSFSSSDDDDDDDDDNDDDDGEKPISQLATKKRRRSDHVLQKPNATDEVVGSKMNEWAQLNFREITKDYFYNGLAAVTFGKTLESAIEAVETELDEFHAKRREPPLSKLDMLEEKLWTRSVKDRKRYAEHERNSGIIPLQDNKRLRSLSRDGIGRRRRALKEDKRQIDFVNRPVLFEADPQSRVSMASDCGQGDCPFCVKIKKLSASKSGNGKTNDAIGDGNEQEKSSIFSPYFHPCRLKDSWRETDLEEEPEMTNGKKKKKGGRPPRRRISGGRNSNKSGAILKEMLTSFHFIQAYQSGYLS